jgi:hypothetical protein
MRRWIMSGALAALLSGCSTPTRPPDSEVTLELSVSPTSAQPGDVVTAEATFSNRGRTTVYYSKGCSTVMGIGFGLLDPAGRPVDLANPRVQPACADDIVELRPHEEKTATLRFDGTLYTYASAYPAPVGTYTLIASFAYQRTKDASGTIALERRATFRWNSP